MYTCQLKSIQSKATPFAVCHARMNMKAHVGLYRVTSSWADAEFVYKGGGGHPPNPRPGVGG